MQAGRDALLDALLRNPVLYVSTPFSFLPCDFAHRPRGCLPFLSLNPNSEIWSRPRRRSRPRCIGIP